MRSTDRRLKALTAAAMLAISSVLTVVLLVVPGGAPQSPIAAVGCAVLAGGLVLFGERLPRVVVFAVAPLSVVMIGLAVHEAPTTGDNVVYYMLPVVWTASFFSPGWIVGTVACVIVVHTTVVTTMPAGMGSVDRLIDVGASTSIVAAVAYWLASSNRRRMGELRHEARVDSLTGLLNRRGFQERYRAELSRMARHDLQLAVVCLDIDHFKAINDTHGHEHGDTILEGLGHVLATSLRAADVAARLGGEEFVVLLPGAGEDEARVLADRVLQRVSDRLGVTVSAGVAGARGEAGIDGLLERADQALYAAKDAGRDRVVVAA